MDIASLFREFGYPALVTGVLLYLYIRLRDEITKMIVSVDRLTTQVEELRKDFERFCREGK